MKLLYCLSILGICPDGSSYDSFQGQADSELVRLHSLLRTCSQLRSEYSPIFYGSHVFHLRIVSGMYRAAKDQKICDHEQFRKRQPRGSLLRWKSLPAPVLLAFREIMVSVSPEVLLSQGFVPTGKGLPYLSSFLSLAPNIEVLHITTCISHSIAATKSLARLVADFIPAKLLPKLMRVVLHVSPQQSVMNGMLYPDLHKWAPLEWFKGESRSFAEPQCGLSHMRESHFRVTDKRRLSSKVDEKTAEAESVQVKTKENAKGKRRKEWTVTGGTNELHPVTWILQPHPMTTGTARHDNRSGSLEEAVLSNPLEHELGPMPSPISSLGEETPPAMPSMDQNLKSDWSGKITIAQLRQEIDRINRLLRAR